MPRSCQGPRSAPHSVQQRFTVLLLGRIETHARICFRHLDADRKEEAVRETVALTWKWYCRLAEKGRDAADFVSVLATYAVRAVRCGRRLCGMDPAKDALSPRAQQLHGFKVQALPVGRRVCHNELYGDVHGQRHLDEYEEFLHDNAATPPPDAAAFRIDFRTWLARWADRDRRLINAASMGERTQDLARRFGLTPGRVSQLRAAFRADWTRFCGDDAGPA